MLKSSLPVPLVNQRIEDRVTERADEVEVDVGFVEPEWNVPEGEF